MHVYRPASFTPTARMCISPEGSRLTRASVSAAMPSPLFQMMTASGEARTRHVKVTLSPREAVWSDGGVIIFGAAELERNKKSRWNNHLSLLSQITETITASRGYELERPCEFMHVFASCVLSTPSWRN